MAYLEPGNTCWRREAAGRVAFLVDTQAYFSALRLALRNAKHSVLLLGWSFDPRTRLQPDGIEADRDEPDSIGRLLIEIAAERLDLDIRVLIWKSALPIAMSQEFFPHRAQAWFLGSRVRFRLDDAVPFGGCHHQKVVVIDDRLAFCGGGDISIDRWDTTAHLDVDSRRLDPSRAYHKPRHEVVMMVDGGAARRAGWANSPASVGAARPARRFHRPSPMRRRIRGRWTCGRRSATFVSLSSGRSRPGAVARRCMNGVGWRLRRSRGPVAASIWKTSISRRRSSPKPWASDWRIRTVPKSC